jgi:16S rRNA (cytidine1402-2'-O)-methyltransferase
MSANLTLIPTPIAESLPLEPVALALLEAVCLLPESVILVEEHKVARRRWIEWGLPREAIDRFQLLNEHSHPDETRDLVRSMRTGKKYYLMSDAGLPAFCDPGQTLVNACHEGGLKVTSTPFPNSISLALSLSGFSHSRFYFAGFLPANSEERKQELFRLSKMSETIILMDTPYRMAAVLNDVAQAAGLKKRKCFLAMDLNGSDELLIRGECSEVNARVKTMGKREFILVLAAV